MDARQLDEAQRALAGGATFDEVAGAKFADLPASVGRPWDLGYLKWPSIPEAWLDVVYDLEPGEVSGVVSGPGGRHWLLSVVARRPNEEMTFEVVKPVLVRRHQAGEAKTARKRADEALRAAASVELDPS